MNRTTVSDGAKNCAFRKPPVQAVFKDYKLCEKALVFDPKKYPESQAKTGGAKPQQPQQQKQEKKLPSSCTPTTRLP
ncbi:hypothetical protein KR074_001921 [Drosophila pseudoananassae]|nr:hypothetical protein KR074_001921 [Drosophila pseudoananassae]